HTTPPPLPYTTLFRSERAEQTAQVQHQERFLAEAHLALREIATLLKDDTVRLALNLHEEAQVRQQRPGDEERDLVRRGELGLSRSEEHTSELQSRFDI